MDEGTQTALPATNASEGLTPPWVVWNRVPEPLRVQARSLIALSRRLNARSTHLPDGPRPLLPADTVALRTLYGGFWFDAADTKLTPWIRRHATWEMDVVRFLRSTVQPGTVAVDVGANVGFLTVLLSRLVGPAGRVHAFEPLPRTVDILRANLWRHECANTTVHVAAALDRAGRVAFDRDPEGDSGAHVELDAAGALDVAAVTLDDVVADRPVGVLKVDVEGAEPLVLAGAAALIAESPRLVAVAEFRGGRHLDGSSGAEALERYAAFGLSPHVLRPDGRAVPASHDEILATAAAAETINIVLRRRS